jgi:ElaB/YqjD/DUF883 family membrane-anchored ribosome-binding protein
MTSTRQLRASGSEYADDARGITAQALENTKEFANQAFEKAGEKMRDLRYGVKDIASRGANSMGEYAQATTRYIADEPVKSALIAAAIGAAVAGLVIALRRSSSSTRRYY